MSTTKGGTWRLRWKELENRPRVLGALGGAIFAIGSFALQFLDDEPVSVVPLAVMSPSPEWFGLSSSLKWLRETLRSEKNNPDARHNYRLQPAAGYAGGG